jgi:hypothetical protein
MPPSNLVQSCLPKMLNAFSILRGKLPSRPRRIILLGPEGVGKTTLSYRLMNVGTFPVAIPPGMFCVTQHAWWKGQAYQLVDVGGDGLSFRTLPYLKKTYYNTDCLMLYLVDSTNPDLKEAVRVLEDHLPHMVAQGMRFLWIVPNKQDLLTNEDAIAAGEAIRFEFTRLLMPYTGKIMTSIGSGGRFSGLTGVGVGDVFDEIPLFLENYAGFVPSVGVLRNDIEEAEPAESPEKIDLTSKTDLKWANMDAEEFYEAVKSKTIIINSPYTQLRIAYLVLLECQVNGQGIYEAAHIMKLNGWFSTEVYPRPHRQVPSL